MRWKGVRYSLSRLIRGISTITLIANGSVPSPLLGCPTYSDFAVPKTRSAVTVASVIPPEFAEQKGYRQVVDDAKKPANFAGSYRVSIDTCGTSMIVVMIANLKTGKVQRAGCLAWVYKGEHPELPIGLRYRIDSQLLVAYGCTSGVQPCGAHFYRIEEDELHLVCFAPFKGNIVDSDLPPGYKSLPTILQKR